MKNYEETANAVIKGIETYKNRQKQRRRILLHTAIPTCCVLLVGAAVFAVRQSRQPEKFSEDALYPGIIDTIDDSNETPDIALSSDRIVIHVMDDFPAPRMGIALLLDDFIAMDQDEIDRYYGFSFSPKLPEDLQPWKNHIGIYRQDGGTGEIYYDQNVYNFSNEDITRGVTVTVDKGGLPFFCFRVPTKELECSVIQNIEVILAQSSDGGYHAEFLHKNAGFYVYAIGLTKEEFVDVIASILQ